MLAKTTFHGSHAMTSDPHPLILVVDDNATDVFFLQMKLAMAGITNPIERVEDGAEAIAWLERHFDQTAADHATLHMVFLDLNMPRMDGFAVLEWIQARDLNERLTVVVLTTSAEPTDRERARQLGAHGYLVKYASPEALRGVCDLASQRAAVHVS
jgi:two-component system response regulator